MSKAVKNLILNSYKSKEYFGDNAGGILVDIRGTTSNNTNDLRAALAKKNIKVTVVRNALAKGVLAETPLADLTKFLQGANALIYSEGNVIDALGVARELIEWTKKIETLQVKAAYYEGVLYEGKAGFEQLSKLPTRAEAQGNVVTLLLSPGGKISSILGEIQKKLEAGETIAKIA